MRGVGCFYDWHHKLTGSCVSVPLRGVGCFNQYLENIAKLIGFRPLAGCGLFLQVKLKDYITKVSVPLRGVGCFSTAATTERTIRFPSPCGVWVVSVRALPPPRAIRGFRPLAGCGLFPVRIQQGHRLQEFPSPCGVWVVSECAGKHGHQKGFRPLAGCGLFRK